MTWKENTLWTSKREPMSILISITLLLKNDSATLSLVARLVFKVAEVLGWRMPEMRGRPRLCCYFSCRKTMVRSDMNESADDFLHPARLLAARLHWCMGGSSRKEH